jgi:serine/threonine protein kinase
MAELISTTASFVTQGEQRAAAMLQQLPASWVVICNKTLPTRDGRSYELDFIVIGKRWVFLLDEKSWRGKIIGNDELWMKDDGSTERSPLSKADYIAKVLAGHINWRVPPLKNGEHYVRGGVLLSATEEPPMIREPRAANGVFLLKEACQRLMAIDSQGGNPDVGRLRDAIKKSLVDLSNRLTVPERINDLFTIDEAIAIRPGVRLFHATMDGGVPRLLMVYDLGKDPLAATDLRNFYLRECKVLQELHATGLVAEVKDPFLWSDDFLILPIVPIKGKPLSTYPRPETREEFSQELLIAAACFKGLDIIHSRDILHRAIGPDTVYVLQGGQNPKIAFANFFAARMGTNSIAASLDKAALAAEDPYASYDLTVGYEFATPTTDMFSLALVFLERLSSISIATIRTAIDTDTLPDIQQRWSFIPGEINAELAALFQQILIPESHAAPLTSKEIATQLTELARRLRTEVQEEETYLLNGQYKVERILGQGAMARTFLVRRTDYPELELSVLKQFHQPEEVFDQAKDEYRALMEVKSSYFPSIREIYHLQDDAHIKMEYIPGPTLQNIEAEFPWPLDRWWVFAQDLLNALEELEKKELLHRDIKPSNIILSEDDNHLVLIDFGFAMQQSAASKIRFAGTPLYLPPEAISSSKPPPSCDRYAAGVVLFKMLTGYLPFELGNGQRRDLRIPPEIIDEKVRRIAQVLLRVVANDPSERPESTSQIRQELQNAMLAIEEPEETRQLPDQTNLWVDNIRSLYRNSTTGNANNRGLDTDFVRETYVQTALDQQLLPAIFMHHPHVVFLTGNPGDGKTAFLEQVQQELEKRRARRTEHDASGWQWEDKGHIFRSCYDASESHDGYSADDQLARRLEGLQGAHAPTTPLTVLIAINDGRLVDFFDRHKERFSWLAAQVQQFRHNMELPSTDVWIVNLTRRSFVGFPDADYPSIFTSVVNSLISEDKWAICDSCSAQTVCPIRANAVALRKKKIRQRLEYLLLLTHLRHQRHTTMRDLRSALAYLITGNASCTHVHASRHDEEASASLIDLNYWRSAFAPLEIQDELLKDLMALDPARFPHPHLDRYLHFHQFIEEAEARQALFADETDLPVQRFKDEIEWMAAMKRRLYFEAKSVKAQADTGLTLPKVRAVSLLPYKFADIFIALLDDSLEDAIRILELLALGILRSDGIVEDDNLLKGTLSVQVSASEEQQLMVLKQFPLSNFKLHGEQSASEEMIERIPETVILEHVSGFPRLEITLDLFELLMRMANGLLPDALEYQPLLEDLKSFKDALLLEETRELVLIEGGYRVHRITQEAGRIVHTAIYM